MGKKLVSDSKKYTDNKTVTGMKQPESDKTFLNLVREQSVEIYLVLMLGIYPLFMVNGYSDLVFKKWGMLKYCSFALIILSILFWLISDVIQKNGKKNRISVTDWFVAGYLVCVMISYAGAANRQASLWGVDTWYTGLVFQLILIGIYFGISRGYTEIKYLKYLTAIIGVVVGLLVILQRMGVDIFHLYQGYGEEVRLNFVTTLGQVTWASGYLSILLAAGMGVYFLTEERKNKIFFGVCIGVGFVMEMLLNCDSGVISIMCTWLVLLWMTIGNRERLLHLTEITIIALASVAATGILERIAGDKLVAIDAVYTKTAQSMIILLLLAVIAVFYCLLRKDKILISDQPKTIVMLRVIYLGILVAAVAAVAVLFILHGKGYFAGSPTENYFRFTVWWGNSRGFIWRTGGAVFGDFNIFRKLFGCGPDGFTPYAYGLMGDAINEFWHNQLVPNVHNEWFNAVINYGIIGGSTYLGIFISGAYTYLKCAGRAEKTGKQKQDNAILLGIGLATAAYIVHNILCYQQIIGTPVIFILLGLGAGKLRPKAA